MLSLYVLALFLLSRLANETRITPALNQHSGIIYILMTLVTFYFMSTFSNVRPNFGRYD